MQKAEKASIFKNETFEGKHLKHSDSDASWFQIIKALKMPYVTQPTFSYNGKITAEEIHEAIRYLNGSKKSMDTDGVHPLMLKH